MEIVIKPSKTYTLNIQHLLRYKELLVLLAKRDIGLRYKFTLLGVFWVCIQVGITTSIFSFVFTKISHTFSPSVPYPVFVLLGLLFWNYFQGSMQRVSNSLLTNQSLITKVYFPRIILPLSSMFVGIIDFILTLFLFLLVSFFFHVSISFIGFFLLLPCLFITYLTALGIGMFFSTIQVKYSDVKQLLPFVTTLLFFLTPVIYPLRFLPPKTLSWISYINPLAGVIDTMRHAFFQTEPVEGTHFAISFVSSLAIFYVGLIVFNTMHKEIADFL